MNDKLVEKPVMQKELAVRNWNEQWRWISIQATTDAVVEYAEFGSLKRWPSWDDERPSDMYTLDVDARFDFQQVLAWVMGHGQTGE